MEGTTRLSKEKAGYGYKYTELAQINAYLESKGESYYQYTETFGDHDYIMTVKVKRDGTESNPIRGCRIIGTNTLSGKSNAAQEMGSAITYARRYSLLMVYGLATEDDDAESLTRNPQPRNTAPQKPANSNTGTTSQANAQKPAQRATGAQNRASGKMTEEQKAELIELAHRKGKNLDFSKTIDYNTMTAYLGGLPDRETA